jgi:hypothetical protein
METMLHGKGWSKNQVFIHLMSETARMILSILYTMICISRYIRCSKSDCCTIVKIFLCTLEELRICSVCNSDKWFIAMCCIDFVTYTGKIYLIFGYLFRVIRWHNKMEESSMMTWMSSNINIVADATTKAKYIIALEAPRELSVVQSVLVLCSSIVWQ